MKKRGPLHEIVAPSCLWIALFEKRSYMFSGILPPLPTPFTADGALDLDALRSNIEKLNATGLTGYVALGTNSEAVHVTPEEAAQVFATVKQAAAPGKIVIAGTGQLSTAATLDMTKRAADAGCDAALIVTPFYYKNSMTGEALKKHYFTIADHSPLPVMIYNVPANTGLNVVSSIVAVIAQHPNIVGIKDSSGDINQLAETVRLTRKQDDKETSRQGSVNPAQRAPDAKRRTRRDRTRAAGPADVRSASSAEFAVFSGNYGAMLPSLSFGVAGGILAVSNIAPNECVQIYDLFRQGQVAAAGELHLRLLPVARAVTSQFGVPGLKAALDMLGYHGGYPRLPLLPLVENQRTELEKVLREAELL
jgi:4-hydroxy-2-oxoglutarate aldolase